MCVGAKVALHAHAFKDRLHVAAAEGHYALVEYLIKRGSNVNAEDRWGNTPLVDAMSNGHKEVTDFLRTHVVEAVGPEHRLDVTTSLLRKLQAGGGSVPGRALTRALQIYPALTDAVQATVDLDADDNLVVVDPAPLRARCGGLALDVCDARDAETDATTMLLVILRSRCIYYQSLQPFGFTL